MLAIAVIWMHNLQPASHGDGSSGSKGTSLQGWCYRWLETVQPRLDSHSWGQQRPLFLIFQVPCWSSKYSLTRRNGAIGKCMPSYTQCDYKLWGSNFLIIGGLPLCDVEFHSEMGNWKLPAFAFLSDFSQILHMLFIRRSFTSIAVVFDFKNKDIFSCQGSM